MKWFKLRQNFALVCMVRPAYIFLIMMWFSDCVMVIIGVFASNVQEVVNFQKKWPWNSTVEETKLLFAWLRDILMKWIVLSNHQNQNNCSGHNLKGPSLLFSTLMCYFLPSTFTASHSTWRSFRVWLRPSSNIFLLGWEGGRSNVHQKKLYD